MTTATQSAGVLLRALSFLRKGEVLCARAVLEQEISDCRELGIEPDTIVLQALNWIDMAHGHLTYIQNAREVIERAIL